MKDIRDYDLTARNTFGIAAACRRFVEFGSVAELRAALAALTEADRPLLAIGGGSNLLFTGDFAGTVLHSAIKGVECTDCAGGVLLRVGSGETWDDIVALCVANGWHGAENLSLIPGEVGASAVQNIGAYGVEAKDIIHEVEAVGVADGKAVKFGVGDCGYAYRHSKFKGEWRGRYIITHVTYRLSKEFRPAVRRIRDSKLPDPRKQGNAGSFFMNPVVGRGKYEELAAQYPGMPHYTVDGGREKIPAGWLIEQCGWKGRSLGCAGVHAKQALVLVNLGGATGQDVLRLCEAIVADVYGKFGIRISPEVNIL